MRPFLDSRRLGEKGWEHVVSSIAVCFLCNAVFHRTGKGRSYHMEEHVGENWNWNSG